MVTVSYADILHLKHLQRGRLLCLIGVILAIYVGVIIYFHKLYIPLKIIKKYRFVHDKDEEISPKQASSLSKDQLCYGRGVHPKIEKGFEKTLDHLDFRKETFYYLDNFKNPCFYRNVSYYNGHHLKTPFHTLRCAPYFFIIGMPKSATTDIWNGLLNHPGVWVKGSKKEPFYFTRKRFLIGKDRWSLDQYLDMFHHTTNVIQSTPFQDNWTKDKLFFNLITGEGTVDVSHDNDNWQLVPGNEGCNEPRVLNADYLYHLNPKMRLICILRNPVERVWSDYLYEARSIKYNISVEGFHSSVLEAMANHRDCRKYFTDRGCAYNSSLETFQNRLRVGMYHIFLEDWFRIFPKEQILILQYEEYIKNRTTYMNKIFQFLDLRPMTEREKLLQEKRSISNPRNRKEKSIGDMMNKTRQILTEFYRPYNKRLAELLNESKYLWNS